MERMCKKIELLELGSCELILAFILGFYDGKGKLGTIKISSDSIKYDRTYKNKFYNRK